MLIKEYNKFLDTRLNENVQAAKTYLKNLALVKKKAKDEKATLTPEEVRRAENNPEFLKIKEMLRDNPGYTYLFTKFFFDEGVEMTELEQVYSKLKELRQSLNLLSMPIEKFGDVKPSDEDPRKGFERLLDDIAKIETSRVVKKWVNQLPGDLRREYQNAPVVQKEKIEGIATAFEEFGKEPDGSKDEKKNKELQDLFFLKVRRYKNITELITAANSYIKAANNASTSKFLQAIQRTNVKYGHMNGAEIVFDENGILIIEVRSFAANKDLNSNTSHCIASSSGQWDNYVAGDNNYNKQYYIYNFNLPPSDNNSVIGITIEPNYRIRACHAKNDAGISGSIKSILKEWEKKYKIDEDLFEILAPMTPAEVEAKKKRVIANKEIIKPGLSLEKVKQYLEEGADPNAQQGKPLNNSVQEDNYDKTKFLLEQGAIPNIGNAIKYAKNLDMIKLLVDYGSTITNDVFNSIINDYDAVEYVLKAGVDPNFEKGLPLRNAAKLGRTDIMKLLIKYGANIAERRYMVVKWALEWAQIDAIKLLFEELEKSGSKVDRDFLETSQFKHWAQTSDKVSEDKIKEVVDFLDQYGTK
jgi:hypothetical protein